MAWVKMDLLFDVTVLVCAFKSLHNCPLRTPFQLTVYGRGIDGDANSPAIETSQHSTGSRRCLYFQGMISNVPHAPLDQAPFHHFGGSKFWAILCNIQAIHYELLISTWQRPQHTDVDSSRHPEIIDAVSHINPNIGTYEDIIYNISDWELGALLTQRPASCNIKTPSSLIEP
ncbi:uncharacterized protein ARMOST_16123 [Armillaria ostoyae]|uniref:Uncharacterized protein n=1 Tax=Armillaria ostoyae TaxID=47428 RepID=A0A284RVB5_ARMOS|nr:uncharacterized protein ARMOST_16123 [Armillaria ostoyae]